MKLVKTHGSLNEIFALEAAPGAWASDAELRDFVRRVCDRDSWTGGSDGIYLYDPNAAYDRKTVYDRKTQRTRAWFFNPDGSAAEFCGNGMRGLGRLMLDRRGTDTEVIASGGRDYRVRRAPSTPEGVRQVLLELPPLSFDDGELPAAFAGFTAVRVPNPHVISVVGEYVEPDLIELGKRADEDFPAGANVSFLLPHGDTRTDAPEVFVRTFERGAGLTPSCGSGVVASRAAYSKVTGLAPERRLVVRNAGGVAAASIRVHDGAWYPVLEGNGTVVYRAEVDRAGRQLDSVERAAAENDAYTTLDERNTAFLKSHGINTAHP
jgi:diaminopimelate epimerase